MLQMSMAELGFEFTSVSHQAVVEALSSRLLTH